MLKPPKEITIFLPTRYCKKSMNSDNGDFVDLYINAIETGVLLNCCFLRVNMEMALKSSIDKIVISLEYQYAMHLNLFIFELKFILNCLSQPLILSLRCFIEF